MLSVNRVYWHFVKRNPEIEQKKASAQVIRAEAMSRLHPIWARREPKA